MNSDIRLVQQGLDVWMDVWMDLWIFGLLDLRELFAALSDNRPTSWRSAL
jgi:hypothetical protein